MTRTETLTCLSNWFSQRDIKLGKKAQKFINLVFACLFTCNRQHNLNFCCTYRARKRKKLFAMLLTLLGVEKDYYDSE